MALLDADLTVESGAKIVMDGFFEVAGSCDTSGSITLDPSSGSFTTDNTMVCEFLKTLLVLVHSASDFKIFFVLSTVHIHQVT